MPPLPGFNHSRVIWRTAGGLSEVVVDESCAAIIVLVVNTRDSPNRIGLAFMSEPPWLAQRSLAMRGGPGLPHVVWGRPNSIPCPMGCKEGCFQGGMFLSLLHERMQRADWIKNAASHMRKGSASTGAAW